MPELPEVECTRRRIQRQVEGRTIARFTASWARQVQPSIRTARRWLTDRLILRLTRRGKYLVIHLDNQTYLLVHLGMSGRLETSRDPAYQPAHLRAQWLLSDQNRLLFCDARKFGRIVCCQQLDSVLGKMGPEPLEDGFTTPAWYPSLQKSRRPIKAFLLDQTTVAGLGNIYADESLFRAHLHPLRPAQDLSRPETTRLIRAIRRVLKTAIELNGSSIDWAYPDGKMQTRLQVYQRTNMPCLRCATPIERISLQNRSTHFCPQCQMQTP